MNPLDQLDAYLIGAWNADSNNDTDLLAAYAARARGALERLRFVANAKAEEVERLERRVKGAP